MKRLLRILLIGLASFVVLLGLLFTLAINGVIGPPKASPDAIANSVVRDAAKMDRAFELPVAKAYTRELDWQSNGSTCGPASVANALRSWGDAGTSESSVLEGTGLCRTGTCFMGLTLDELATVARKAGEKEVEVVRGLNAEEFREALQGSNDPSQRLIVNFTRKPIFGAGGGHFSPIGGYLEDDDLVLVLDVNADYQPWLIERDRLFAAMDTMDGENKRGLLVLRRPAS